MIPLSPKKRLFVGGESAGDICPLTLLQGGEL